MMTQNRLRLVVLRFAPADPVRRAHCFLRRCKSDRFLTLANLVNILTQSAHVAIIAIGMTFVLLVGGIDLSVGANMYVTVAILGLYLNSLPAAVSFPIALLIGLVFGAINGLIITRLRVAAFIATLSTLFIGRGMAIYLTGTKGVFFNDEILAIGRANWLGIPSGIWAFVAVFVVAFIVLRQTSFGREIYAVGADREGAVTAGINVRRVIFSVYCISGVCAAFGGLVSASQVASAYSTFGLQKEFPVIAAAVLGGTSLFGGRGGVVGTVLGSILIQTVGSGLVMLNADPYVYPLIISVIIFVAVLVDSQRSALLDRSGAAEEFESSHR